ncbi:MAG TPA: dihydrofolate reductase family protein [Chitinophaga sp.]|uniref:dihydrofolate reductase family protein n=1 Tax=Chitinophaga sp. TaxID=1869181 RepID=UPI002D1738CE|nr:dihydrofolate reductase family protein [Chitinophaga sp.]HVI44031.1 dihydrofolate reductase family protein [Chitinophaga sp.]
MTNYVFTHDTSLKDNENVQFITADVPTFVNSVKATPGKDIWLIGGGKLNASMLQHDLIDEMILHVMPVILGEGISLFEGAAFQRGFKLVHTKTYSNGVLELGYVK